ncbi:MAG: peptidylprolyl isomerase [Alphaproteobacteria bacterium]|nr:peptidylprolyl isomerase [Alphaproteobacteria bacterium]
MRPSRSSLALALALLAASILAPAVHAQTTAVADPVVARVNGAEIHVSDITEAAQSLPQEYRGMPQNVLMPMLIDQLIDRAAVAALARKEGLEKDPLVQRGIARATEEALENAIMRRDIGPSITEDKLRARYTAEIAGKEGEVEVRARHILVASEADAIKVVAELKKGGDFAALAKARSSDPGAGQGGDLGFFKRTDMVPEFAEAAFALKPGQVSDKPVKTQFGWHVIKVEERRAAPSPSFEQAQDDLRQKVIQEGVQKVLAAARAVVTIERYNPDGTARRATDDAAPPPKP